MAANATSTRAQDVRRFVELDALSILISNLAEFCDGADQVAGRDDLLRETGWDELGVHLPDGDVTDVCRRLWSGDYEEYAEYEVASAESCALTARMCMLLATAEGQAALASLAIRNSRIAEEFAARARARMEGGRDA